MCDPTEVRSYLLARYFGTLRAAQCADYMRMGTESRFRPMWDSNAGMDFSNQPQLENKFEAGPSKVNRNVGGNLWVSPERESEQL